MVWEEAGAVIASDWRAPGVAMCWAAGPPGAISPALELLGIACAVCARHATTLSYPPMGGTPHWLTCASGLSSACSMTTWEVAALKTVTAPILRELQMRRMWNAVAYPEWGG